MKQATSTAILTLVLVGHWTPQTHAQAPAAVVPVALDTAQAKVYVATLQPHTPSRSPNGHATNRVLLYLDPGVMTRQEADVTETINFVRGDVRWRPASGAYVAENTTDHAVRILEIDLQGPPSGPLPLTPLDAPAVDPKRYTVIFENASVRVLRVHFEPHDTGLPHQHMLNRVVLYLNDQTGAKRDEVRLSGPATHSERNDGDQPADRIAVELK